MYIIYLLIFKQHMTLWRKEIWSEMHKLGFLKKLVKFCRTSNNEIYAEVKIGEYLSSEFKVNKRLRQGDAIARLLFNIVLETAIRRYKVETRGTTFDKCSQIMAYADDVVIMDIWLQDVEEVFISLVDKTDKMGLEIYDKKTKYMIASWKTYNENKCIKLGTYNFEIVKD